MAENIDGRTLSLSDRDPNPGPLLPKLMAGRNVSIKNFGQTVKIDVDVPLTEGTRQAIENMGKVCVQQEDTPEYLSSKILQGDRITITDNDHTLTINADVQNGDHKVLASSGDTTPNYLDQKLSGSGVVAVTDNTTSLSVGITPSVTDGQVLTTDNGAVAWKTPATQTGDHKVSVDGTDTANYLENKIEAGTNVSVTKSSGKLVISSTDTGMLNPMTTSGDIITGGASGTPGRLGVGTDGQVLTVSSGVPSWQTIPTQTGDHKVVIDGNDTSPGYLGSKLVQGTGITLTTGANDITIAADTQTGDHKVLSDSGDGLADYLGNKITVSGGLSKELLTVGTNTRVGLSIDTTGSTAGQVLSSTGSGVSWINLPTKIDWAVNPGLGNGSFNQAVDRTFYVRIYPTFEFKKVLDVGIIITGPSASDEWRAAVFDSARNMVAYGTKTGGTVNFQRVSLTMLSDFAPSTTNFYYLAISQHIAGTSNSKILTTTVSSPSFCWYEDVALTSGRAMPSTSSLTASSSKVPIIGLRGR